MTPGFLIRLHLEAKNIVTCFFKYLVTEVYLLRHTEKE